MAYFIDNIEISEKSFIEKLSKKPYVTKEENGNIIICEKETRIQELKFLLSKYDYINSKFIEAFVNQDNVRLEELKVEYGDILSQRQVWRNEINALEIENKS